MGLQEILANYSSEKPPLTMKKYTSFSDLDQSRIEFLINSSFNKTTNPDEFQKTIDPLYFLETTPSAIYILETEAGEYAGTIIAKTIPKTQNTEAITYIDKLAVSPDHQKNGYFWKLMCALEDDLKHHHPQGQAKMALRCNPANECAVPKYDKWSDHKDTMGENQPQWLVYSKGLTANQKMDEHKVAFDYAKEQKVYWQYKDIQIHQDCQNIVQQPAAYALSLPLLGNSP